MNRRAFITGLGTFMILPGAGRIWKAQRSVDPVVAYMRRNGQYLPMTEKMTREFLNTFFFNFRIQP